MSGDLQSMVVFFLFGMAAISLACFVMLVVLYRVRERRNRERLRQTKTDIADLAILFQTMRDIIQQQKALARTFNEDLDKKLDVVRQILAQSLEKNQRLFDRQQALTRELDDARGHVEGLQREIALLRDQASKSGWNLPPPAERPPLREPRPTTTLEPQIVDLFVTPARSKTPPAQAAALNTGNPPGKLADTGVARGANYSEWIRAELDAAGAHPPVEEVPPPPAAPGDAEAARKAFRALLDLEPIAPFEAVPAAPNGPAPSQSPPPASSPFSPAIHARVAEYFDAGMSISDIAHELGIGKGEVRLILSLAKQRKP